MSNTLNQFVLMIYINKLYINNLIKYHMEEFVSNTLMVLYFSSILYKYSNMKYIQIKIHLINKMGVQYK